MHRTGRSAQVNVDLSGPQKTPDIAYADGAFHIVWSETSTGTVRYRKAVLGNDVSMEEYEDHMHLTCWPNPVSGKGTADQVLHVSGGQWISAEIVDAHGRSVRHGAVRSDAVDTSGLPAGSYLLRLKDMHGVHGTVRFEKR